MNITALRRTWITLSGTLVVASIALTLIFSLNLGLDFLGGIRWTVAVNQLETEIPVHRTEVESFFAAQKDQQGRLEKNVKIQSTETGEFLITLENVKDDVLEAIKTDLNAQYAVEEKSFRRVDPSLGASFKQKAFYAIIAALIGIIIFVAWAFRKIPKSVSPWKFGAVAIAALFHDIIIVLGVFTVLGAMLNVELDLQFITALLATLGFSVNDTIVILDRVRENLQRQKGAETFETIIEKSIQQTLRRSINTSISTLLPLVGLLFFGADAIFFFVLALIIGILIGTYSSIFLAAPLLAFWRKQ